MANQLWIYTNPPNSIVQLTADNGVSVMGIPTPHAGRNDAQLVEIPFNTGGIGSLLTVSSDGYQPFKGRAVLIADEGEAYLHMDDFYLVPITNIPPKPIPPAYHGTPDQIIQQVYSHTHADLTTHDGCGKFTEDCCTALHDYHDPMWGHIKKNPGQNQYNGHAVDAIMLLTGSSNGIYDIVYDSVSPNAKPAYNYKGPAEVDLWYYPA